VAGRTVGNAFVATVVNDAVRYVVNNLHGNYRTIRRNRVCRGFTLVEVLVTLVLVTIGIIGSLNAIQAVEMTEDKAKTVDLLQQLAVEKINDLTTVTDPSTYGSSGDFSDRGYPNATWNLDVEPTSVANLDEVTVSAKLGQESQAVTTEIFVQTTTTSATTTSTTP
jgi:prepilin-type N-terminal cleavage/methylation domain-containing protein